MRAPLLVVLLSFLLSFVVPVQANLAVPAQADRQWIQFTERLLAAALGAASARRVLTSALRGSGMEVAEVVAVLDEAGRINALVDNVRTAGYGLPLEIIVVDGDPAGSTIRATSRAMPASSISLYAR